MSVDTHAQRIIALLGRSPGLNDDEIAKALSIAPRQTVNQICRHLESRGVLARERGGRGKIVNRLTSAAPLNVQPLPLTARAPRRVPARRSIEGITFVPRDFAKTLIVIPCSKSKQSKAGAGEQGNRITDSLPEPLAHELKQARALVRDAAAVDETTLIPAWKRYDGSLYGHGRAAVSDLLRAGAHVAIVSGGYGVVLATEPIGMYEAALKPSWWPRQLIPRVLLAYAERHQLCSVRAFAPASSRYRNALEGIAWQGAGIGDALLLMPEAAPGGTLKSPASIGDALVALRNGSLSADWRSSYELALDVR